MTAATLAHSCHSLPCSQDTETLHPVPQRRKLDDSSALFRRSAIASVVLHLLTIALAVIVQYWPSSALVGAPQDQILDVTIIPLSALDTILPKGSTAPDNTPPQIVSEEKPVEPVTRKIEKDSTQRKIIAAKSIATVRPAPSKEREESSSETKEQTNQLSGSQPIGVAHGEAASIEQARISYQDMVATLLARAKRYPERALKRRMTGEGAIRIEISANGSLSDFQIIQSTTTPILDEELRAMVERASPFPAFPADLRKGSLALVVPVAFRLEG